MINAISMKRMGSSCSGLIIVGSISTGDIDKATIVAIAMK